MKFELPEIMEKLFPNPLTIVTQLIATAVLFFALYRLLWKPVKKIMDARTEYEQSKLAEAQRLKEENERLTAEAQTMLNHASAQAQEIVNAAQAEAIKVKDHLIEEGKLKSQQIVAEAQANIVLQKNKLLEDMHEEIVNVALSAAEKMLQTKLDTMEDKHNIEEFIKEVNGR